MTTLSLISFSQVDTGIKDTTKVIISSQVARKIAKDLVRLDGCVQENQELYSKISLVEDREKQKDAKIQILEEKDSNNQVIIHNKDLQINQYEHLTDDLQNEIKTTNDKFIWWRRGTIASGGVIILLLIFVL
jgi:hypothetical protein